MLDRKRGKEISQDGRNAVHGTLLPAYVPGARLSHLHPPILCSAEQLQAGALSPVARERRRYSHHPESTGWDLPWPDWPGF